MIRVYSNKFSNPENVTEKSRLDIIIDFIIQDRFISTEKNSKKYMSR